MCASWLLSLSLFSIFFLFPTVPSPPVSHLPLPLSFPLFSLDRRIFQAYLPYHPFVPFLPPPVCLPLVSPGRRAIQYAQFSDQPLKTLVIHPPQVFQELLAVCDVLLQSDSLPYSVFLALCGGE